MKFKRLNADIPEKKYDRLKVILAKERVSITEFVRSIVDKVLESYKK